MSPTNQVSERDLETEIRLLEVQALNMAARGVNAANVRNFYIRSTRNFVNGLRADVAAGRMTPWQAAEAAQQMRNEVMNMQRARSMDMVLAYAEARKKVGRSMEELLTRYAGERFGTSYDLLDDAQKAAVHMEVVEAAARPSRVDTRNARIAGHAGRALWVATAILAFYNISTAENRVHATGREGANLAGGFVGGLVGGAATGAAYGLALGPVGVTVGVVIGGVLGGLLADEVYLEAAGTGNAGVDAIIDPYTGLMGTDADGLARAIVNECGINMDRALGVFAVLRRDYAMSSDNVAANYARRVRAAGGSVLYALRMHRGMRDMLVRLLRGGISTRGEGQLASWVESL